MATHFASTVMSPIEENGLAPFEGRSKSPSRVKADRNCLLFYVWFDHSVFLFCLVLCLTSQSTAMVISGRSVHLTTFFPWKAWWVVNQYPTSCLGPNITEFVHKLSLVNDHSVYMCHIVYQMLHTKSCDSLDWLLSNLTIFLKWCARHNLKRKREKYRSGQTKRMQISKKL